MLHDSLMNLAKWSWIRREHLKFIKSVYPPLSEEHIPSYEQIEEGCGYMN